jgi:predicted DNA-binding protein
MPKVVLSFKVRQELKETLQNLADDDSRSLSNYIRIILKEHIKEKGLTIKPKK